jgi:hypothetical protein
MSSTVMRRQHHNNISFSMSNAFESFVHASPLSSLPHDPLLSLASNCVRDYFGPIVQTVFDAVVKGGGLLTLSSLCTSIRQECKRVLNEEREKLVIRGKFKVQRAKGPSSHGYVVEASTIRGALLVLLQHDIIAAVPQKLEENPKMSEGDDVESKKKKSLTNNKSLTIHVYKANLHKARLLIRYPRMIEYVRKVMDDTAAILVEILFLEGKLETVDLIYRAVMSENLPKDSDKYTPRQMVVSTLQRLVEGQFLIPVAPLNSDDSLQEVSSKLSSDDDPAIVSLISQGPYRSTIPRSTVWKVHERLLNDSLRAFALGRLVAERYGHKVQAGGSLVTAALKFQSYHRSAEVVSPGDIVPFLPKPVQQALESKTNGGLTSSISKAFVELSQFDYPSVVDEVEEARGHSSGGAFSIATQKLVKHLRDRTIHQCLSDSHSPLAARIVSILRVDGPSEAEHLAEATMEPAKDARVALHGLYRDHIVQLVPLQPGKQHNTSTMVFLWSVDHAQLLRAVRDKVCTAMTNLRLRRQHQANVGKAWMERATNPETQADENDHEEDKVRYHKFCQGLERLDNALMQLDETLMVLYDF